MTTSLVIDGLSVGYRLRSGDVREVVHDVDLCLEPATITGVVGESGCGKSTLATAAIGWLGANGVRLTGRVLVGDVDVYALGDRDRRRLWERTIVYLPQDAGTALHPTRRIGSLFDEVLARQTDLAWPDRRQRTHAALERVLIEDPADACERYAHQFSGGQRQRLALALALVTDPAILVLDEPTTGADATTQAEIAAHISTLLAFSGTAALYISHDIGLLASLADRLAVMYAGQIVESGPTKDVVTDPRHPYTSGLIDAVPRLDGRPVVGIPGIPPGHAVTDRCAFLPRCGRATDVCRTPVPVSTIREGWSVACHHHSDPAEAPTPRDRAVVAGGGPDGDASRLTIRGLVCEYSSRRGPPTRALDDVDFDVAAGEIVGVVGESGSGKSTMLAAVAGLVEPTGGTIELDGAPVPARARTRTTAQRAAIQLVFQDPHTSLNPRHTVRQSMTNAIRRLRPDLSRGKRDDEIRRLFSLVRLPADLEHRYPEQLSGGQKQRVALARALGGEPRVLLCDEVVSALDVSVQAVVLSLLLDIRQSTGVSIVFVSHDIAAVRLVADRIYVMQDGHVRECGHAVDVIGAPQHGYTQQLVASVLAAPARRTASDHDSCEVSRVS